MSLEQWMKVDGYIEEQLLEPDPVLQAALAASDVAGISAINVSPNQGKLLHLLARMAGARSILEIGTLAGYSTIWLARALPAGGRLISLEIDPRHAEVARANLDRAGLQGVTEVRVGQASESLQALADSGAGPFDFVFIDADKPSNPAYFKWALALTRPGGVIVVDNVVRNGAIADPDSADASVIGVRHLFDLIGRDPDVRGRVSATAFQTVGGKGYDGLLVAVVAA